HMQRVAFVWWIDFRRDRVRDKPRAAAALSRSHGDVLLGANTVRHREALDGCGEFGFPEHFARLHIDGFEHLIAVAAEGEASGCREHAGKKSGSLLQRPDFFERLHVKSREFADIAVAAGHLVKRPLSSGPGTITLEIGCQGDHDLASLN